MKQKLLCRTPPKKGESFQGYVERLAFSNHVKPRDLLLFSQVKINYPTTSIKQKNSLVSLLEELTESSGIGRLFDSRLVAKDHKTLFDFDLKKVCLGCLNDYPYFKVAWSFKNYVVCSRHRIPLSSHCTSCGIMITYESALQKKCNECSCSLRAPSHQQDIHEPISDYIFKSFDGSEHSLTKIAKKLKQVKPYIRLVNKGRFDNIESLRKNDLPSFAILQGSSAELMLDEDKSVDTFSKYLASRVNKNQWSRTLNGFREVTSSPSEYKFADVMKRTILERTSDIGDGALSYQLLAKIWKLDASKLTLAIQKSVPDELLITTGLHKIKCSDFTKYQEQIFAVYSDLDK